ncbi:armadillo-type protein [Mycena latifolia]|nr:armadillo-type protein [Mycena latifolia]
MFHPLTRQTTFDSVRSYWSDRNPIGPTINLHAVAKPLIRFQYRRAALAFIAKNRGTPLSREEMEIYSSYLAYVSSSTKVAILRELSERSLSMNDAQAVANSLVLHMSDEFLSSPDAELREAMCMMLAALADGETLAAVLGVRPCMRLMALLRNENPDVTWRALAALKSISISLEGAQAAIAANVLDYVPDLLRSSNTKVRGWTCLVLAELACHDSIRGAIVHVTLCPQLVSLSRDENLDVTWWALSALESITRSVEGAQAAIAANVLDSVPDLIRSSNTEVRGWTCLVLGELAGHDSIRGAMVTLCPQLMSLLRDENLDVTRAVLWVLQSISISLKGAQAAIAANFLDYVPDLLRVFEHQSARMDM